MKVLVSAPSNIALIKYMGKAHISSNVATNPSISYTLPHLRTFVEAEVSATGEDRWELLKGENFYSFEMSATGLTKFMNHLSRMKAHFKISQNLVVRSANEFPSDCGIASSASSFAALTLAVFELAQRLGGEPAAMAQITTREQLAMLSKLGSGSSCRSLFGPYCLWDGEKIEGLKYSEDMNQLHHMVVLSSSSRKEVSSSDAHKRVATSLLFEGRIQRTLTRIEQTQNALKAGQWSELFEVCWAEFWDMHALFETSQPSFGYMEPSSLEVLSIVKNFWRQHSIGPIVTMDAGPNVHLMFKNSDLEWAQMLYRELSGKYKILTSWAKS